MAVSTGSRTEESNSRRILPLKLLAVTARQPVEGELQPGPLDDGGIQLVAEVADLRRRTARAPSESPGCAWCCRRPCRAGPSAAGPVADPIALRTCPTSSWRMRETRAPSCSRAFITLTSRLARDRSSSVAIAGSSAAARCAATFFFLPSTLRAAAATFTARIPYLSSRLSGVPDSA